MALAVSLLLPLAPLAPLALLLLLALLALLALLSLLALLVLLASSPPPLPSALPLVLVAFDPNLPVPLLRLAAAVSPLVLAFPWSSPLSRSWVSEKRGGDNLYDTSNIYGVTHMLFLYFSFLRG